jgi:hypothetical protein
MATQDDKLSAVEMVGGILIVVVLSGLAYAAIAERSISVGAC